MSAPPAFCTVTAPLLATDATDGFVEFHWACVVTDCVVPFESVAVAVSEQFEGAEHVPPLEQPQPCTASEETVGVGGVGVGVGVGVGDVELPQAESIAASEHIASTRFMTTPL